MRSEKQKNSVKKYKKKFSEMTFNERVVFTESYDPRDPDVTRGYHFLHRQKVKREKQRNKILEAIMKMRGIKVKTEEGS
tara:strand:- start:235 stop:471 length:237 start_codon:yes stop_codon:yes gene_type:complete